jgi:hypothetical protein
MEIMPGVGMILCASSARTDPLKYIRMSMAYVQMEEGSIRTRLAPEFPWRGDRYRMEEDRIFWNHREGAEWWPWRRISAEEMPEWYGAFREKALGKFEERERAG